MSHKPDFHLSLTRFCTLRELCTQIRWRKIRYSVASLLTNPVSSSTQPQGIISNTPQKSVGCLLFAPREKSEIFPAGTPFVPAALPHKVSSLCRKRKMQDVRLLRVLSLCSETIALLSDFCSAGWAAHAAFLSQGIICNTPQVMRGVRFLPHAKNQRFFPRGPRLCLRLCPTKCPRFAAVLAGTPLCFRKRKMQDVRLLLVLSLCSETIALLSDFCSAGWAAPAACSFFKDERVLCCRTIMPPRHDQSIS